MSKKKRSTSKKKRPTIEIVSMSCDTIADDGSKKPEVQYVRLLVNGYGVATWDRKWFLHRDCSVEEYVNEAARVLKTALAARPARR